MKTPGRRRAAQSEQRKSPERPGRPSSPLDPAPSPGAASSRGSLNHGHSGRMLV